MHLSETLAWLHLTPESLPSVVLTFVWFGLLRSVRYSGYGIALLSIFGTWLHELMHLVVGALLGASPVSVSLWPKREANGWVLGSVGFTNLTIWNAAFVGFAPLTMLGIAWLFFQYWMVPAFQDGNYLSWLTAGYAVACSLFACVPSTTDVRVAALSAIMYTVVGYGLWQGTN